MLRIIDDFINIWCNYVYCCYCFIVFVLMYVECFDIMWVVFDNYWCVKVFFSKVMFVFRL